MVKSVNYAFFILAGVCSVPHGATAQALIDPTRPPAAMMTRDEMSTLPGSETALSSARLQSVLISPRRRFAIISGVTVALHERFGDAVLVAINESEVTLRSGKTETTLKLYSDVLKLTSSRVTALPTPPQARHPS